MEFIDPKVEELEVVPSDKFEESMLDNLLIK